MKTFKLGRIDVVGIGVPISEERAVLLDRYGWRLFKQYGTAKNGWKYNYSILHLHRVEPVMKGDRVIYKTVLFHKELLGVESRSLVRFRNGDRLDLRVINLRKDN